jgi:SAM-dependent methyltransferase
MRLVSTLTGAIKPPAAYNHRVADLYRKLAQVYHLLFPARGPQLGMIIQHAGEPGARVLDVASGTGEYVAALSEIGYTACGIELDGQMHTQALKQHPELVGLSPPRLTQGDMLHVEKLAPGPWDLAFCIGNSLPHLKRDADVASVITAMWEMTRPSGAVLLQVANFDRVLRDAYLGSVPAATERAGGLETTALVYGLPPLSASTDDGSLVQLKRRYMLRRATDMKEPSETHETLAFSTQLNVGEEVHAAVTPLLVLTRERLGYCLPRAADKQWLGDFEGSEWSIDSPATIVVLS